MKLKVLGSGSSGNCYILDNEDECLILDAGVPIDVVKQALDFNIKKIVGVVASHSHKDHANYIDSFEKMGIKVFKPYAINRNPEFKGNFKVKCFPLVHDVPCFGFWVEHPEMGRLIYATDTQYIKWKFKDINYFLVEANYDSDSLNRQENKAKHVIEGHMSINTTCEFLKANVNEMTQKVILCHLSEDIIDVDSFINKAKKVVSCPIEIAKKGIETELSLTPF